MQTRCTRSSRGRLCKVTRHEEGFVVKIKEVRGMTGYTVFVGMLRAFDVAMFYSGEDTGKCRRSTGSPCLARALRRMVGQPVYRSRSAATFLVRVMRSKPDETSREATGARVAVDAARGAEAIVSRKIKRNTRIRRNRTSGIPRRHFVSLLFCIHSRWLNRIFVVIVARATPHMLRLANVNA